MATPTDARRVEFWFGAVAPPLAEQLAGHGLVASDPAALLGIDRDADAVSRLHCRGLISDAVASKARKELADQLAQIAVPKAEG